MGFFLKFSHSFEDIESLANVLLAVDAFIVGYVIQFTSGTFSREDFLAGDYFDSKYMNPKEQDGRDFYAP